MSEPHGGQPTHYPLAESDATKMLAAGLARAARETGATQREIASHLGYKTSVVLCHMALGRVPIPIERAADVARLLKMDRQAFLLATLQQRHPNVQFESLLGISLPQTSAVAAELEVIAGIPLDKLTQDRVQVLREVVASADPARRWASPAELATLDTLRKNRASGSQQA